MNLRYIVQISDFGDTTPSVAAAWGQQPSKTYIGQGGSLAEAHARAVEAADEPVRAMLKRRRRSERRD